METELPVTEVILKGTLYQIQGVIEHEQQRAADTYSVYHQSKSLVRMRLPLHGPIKGNSGNSLRWLVETKQNGFLQAVRRGDSGVSKISYTARLQAIPGKNLDDYNLEAQRQGVSLAHILGVGSVEISELPGNTARVIFDATHTRERKLFNAWTESLIAEMNRLGFRDIEAVEEKPVEDFIHRKIAEYFSVDDIRELCLDLGIKYEDLPGDNTPNSKAYHLVHVCQRHGKSNQLIEQLNMLRSFVNWKDLRF